MEQINYIKHLNAVFLQFSKDSRLNPTHISLYVPLFQLWNNYHFPDNFHINREEVMRYSKIGSKTTYHRCIRELHHWKYLLYEPSHNPFHGSKIKMFNFGTSDGQVLYPSHTIIGTSNGQAVVPINKHIQTGINNTNGNKLDRPKNENEVINFFQKKITGTDTKILQPLPVYRLESRRENKIIDWQATARNWMLKAEELKTEKTEVAVSQNTDNLKTSSNKNYSEPL
ncbi:MAG: hypothetical protein R2816_03290 [Flavobacteriaceae bacterium]